jgi:predicted transcriptional regulator
MTKGKSPPETPASFDTVMELAPLFMELFDFVRTSNDLHDIDPISTLILATVTVSDDDNQPMTAEDIALFLGTPLETVKSKLRQLMKTGIIDQEDERYRYNPPRDFTPDEKRRMDAIKRRFEKLRAALVRPLDS